MTMSISRASIRRPVAVWLAIVFCLIGGLWGGLNTVGRLEDPSFTLKTALVFVPYPGATAMEVEEEVADVVESALQQMKQLDRVESKSMPGMAQITVEIEMTYGPTRSRRSGTKCAAASATLKEISPPPVRSLRSSMTISATSTACSML